MTVYLLLVTLSILLFELATLLRMTGDAKEIVRRSLESMRVLSSPELGDEEKEAVTRRAAVGISKATTYFGAKLLLICVLLYSLFLMAVAQFPDLRGETLGSLFSPAKMAILTAAIVGYVWARKAVLTRL
jgi:hypothetical protein